MSNFKNKYLKYKSKYLQLLNLKYNQIGGDLPIINDIDSINLFTDPEMEKYMNPMYGLVLCYIGTIPNFYWLQKNRFFFDENLKKQGQFITKICKDIPGTIQPTNNLMNLKPIDYGRFIAIKYISMITKTKYNLIEHPKKFYIDDYTSELLEKYISTVNKESYFLKNSNDIFIFHTILYCLCWVANNDDGIAEYYKGIEEIYSLLSKFSTINFPPLVLKKQEKKNSFEEIVLKITQQEFKIYNQEWAQNFCIDEKKKTYPDCGEITALNLINLLIKFSLTFNISVLKPSFIPQLCEFYEVFKNFNLMSNINYKPEIFGKYLNARDAWSYLIINYANNNLRFDATCKSTSQTSIGYDIDAGLSLDYKTSNFLQLIKNLLGIEKWEDLENDNIKNIKDDTQNGIGYITITHNTLGEFIIHCERGHYYMEKTQENKDIPIDISNLTCEQQYKICLLKQNIQPTIENYLHINFSSELLKKTFELSSGRFKKALFVLSLTNKYDSDLRRRIQIDVYDDIDPYVDTDDDTDDDTDFFKEIAKNYGKNKNIDEYTYKCKNFNFIKKIPAYKHLKFYIMNNNPLVIENIDLSSLSQLIFIGDKFLYEYKRLKSIDLSSLSLLKSIGDYFMWRCEDLTSIVLPNNSQLESIGNEFMEYCKSLTSINLSSLSQLQSIGNNFMRGCSGLEDIILSNLTNLESIGDYFLEDCNNLIKIDLSFLSYLRSIGNNFMSKCEYLKSINFPPCFQLRSIGDYFMYYCRGLEDINLSSLSQLQSIGNNFLGSCIGLKIINLSPLKNLESIGNRFMSKCSGLEDIILSNLTNLESIGDYFLEDCNNLIKIDLSFLSNLKSIGNDFICKCENLTSIVLPTNLKLESIGNEFMSNCKNLTSINLSSLSQLQSIGYNFMHGCKSLKNIDLSSLSQLKSIGYNFMNNIEKITITCSKKHKEIIDQYNSSQSRYTFIIK